ncbi:MAG: hypothetical protein COA85_13205 [Robiginitomaculum sp.]|nr:MAG: hypothetical protein COA85_13205 [Robiginitomaculum sp.]
MSVSDFRRVAQKCPGVFSVLAILAINWKGLNQHPVPDEWLGYSTRSTMRQRKSPENRRATHPINAMLNYAYGMLEVQTRINVITKGYDPTKGILHGEKYNDCHTFVFDQMEPSRPLVDRRIIALIKDNTFLPPLTSPLTLPGLADLTRSWRG